MAAAAQERYGAAATLDAEAAQASPASRDVDSPDASPRVGNPHGTQAPQFDEPPEYSPPLPRVSGSRRHEARAKQAAREAKRRAEFVARCQEKQIPDDAIPPDTPAHVYRMAQSILSDWHGKRTARWLEHEAKARSGYPIALMREAVGGDAADFRDYDTRLVIAAALMLLALSKRVKRKGRWTLLVSGYGLSALGACLHEPGKPLERPSRNSIGGGGRKPEKVRANAAKARWRDHERTTPVSSFKPILQRLRDVGFLYAQQLPAQCVKAWERDSRPGHEHHVRNRYWLACLSFPVLKRARRASPTPLKSSILEMMQAEFERLNAIAFDWIAAHLAPS